MPFAPDVAEFLDNAPDLTPQESSRLTRALDLIEQQKKVAKERQEGSYNKAAAAFDVGMDAGAYGVGVAAGGALKGLSRLNRYNPPVAALDAILPERFSPSRLMGEAGQNASDYYSERQKKKSQELEDLGLENALGSRIAGIAGQGIVSSAPALALAPIGLPAVAGAAAVQSFGQVYDEADRSGYGADKSLIPAMIAGGVTYGLTTLGGKSGAEALIKLFNKPAAVAVAEIGPRNLATWFSATARSVAVEIPEEGYDQLSQNLTARLSYDKERPIEAGLIEAMSLGGALGGFAGGVVNGLNVSRNRRAGWMVLNLSTEQMRRMRLRRKD